MNILNSNETNWPTRLYLLDIARGVASFAVILWHWQHFAFKGDVLSETFIRVNQPFYGVLKLFYEHGAKGVEFFFVLSGFIFFWLYQDNINNRKVGLKMFWISRLSRLYPLHIITLLIVALLQFVYHYRSQEFFVYQFNDAYHFVLNLFFASNWGFQNGFSYNGPVWSVSIEVLLYAVFFGMMYFKWSGFFKCLIVSFGSFIGFLITNNPIMIGLACFFFGGITFKFTSNIYTTQPKLRYLVFGICILSWLLVFTDCYIFNITRYFKHSGIGKTALAIFPTYILFASTISSLAFSELYNKVKVKYFGWIGDITYSSYLIHFPLQIVFALAALNNVFEKEFFLRPLFFILFFVILIPVSYFIFVRIEKPVQKLIRNHYNAK